MNNYIPGKGIFSFFSGELNLQDIQSTFTATDTNHSPRNDIDTEVNVVYAEECVIDSSNEDVEVLIKDLKKLKEENEKLKEENEKLKEENENLKKRIEIDNALDKIHKSIPSLTEVNEMLDKVFSPNH